MISHKEQELRNILIRSLAGKKTVILNADLNLAKPLTLSAEALVCDSTFRHTGDK